MKTNIIKHQVAGIINRIVSVVRDYFNFWNITIC